MGSGWGVLGLVWFKMAGESMSSINTVSVGMFKSGYHIASPCKLLKVRYFVPSSYLMLEGVDQVTVMMSCTITTYGLP